MFLQSEQKKKPHEFDRGAIFNQILKNEFTSC
ncbi:MAG: DUF1497 domain-containing protein [Fibrobacter sp.]|nr:DUF1497 domain-containing protein [Fibrobacter sp.]